MTDLEKIYECLIDKTYQNKIQFEIVLSEIEDKELSVGFLFDLLLKHIYYDADKQTILELMAENLGEIKPRQYIKQCHYTFTEKIKQINDEIMSINKFIMDSLTILLSVVDSKGNLTEQKDKFEKVVSEFKTKEHLQKLKECLLSAELYEVIGIVDKYLI